MENELFDVFGLGNDRPSTIAGSTGEELLPGTIDIIPGGQGAIGLEMQGSDLLGGNLEPLLLGDIAPLDVTVANNEEGSLVLDIDRNGRLEALTDGIMIIRRLFGFAGETVVRDAVAPDGTRTDAAEITSYLDELGLLLDVDGDGQLTALTDGIMIIRDLFGFAGDIVIRDAVAPGAPRDTVEAVTAYLAELKSITLTPEPEPEPEPETAPVVEVSPANGEEMVNLTRETVVRFGEMVDPATVNDDSFFLIANGEEVAGRIVVSSTEEFATFFYDEPLPGATEVRVVVEGDAIIGRDGDAIDADGDGNAGGTLTADFRTLPLTRIEGTDVFGFVFDSFNTNADGSNIPIVGATIRVDAFPEANAVTDENGFFRLEDVPAPEFSVHIDGSTADNAPEGTVYATVGKLFESVPGQETQLSMDGETFDIFLPPLATDDIQELSETEDTDVEFGDAGVAQLQALFPDVDASVWEQTRVTFPAGSAQDEDGNAATQATIIPVDPERLPAPLPPGVELPLVISIQAGGEAGFSQAGGATNFDVPAPVTFPNVDGLAPGEQSLIWSFNHDSGDWEVVGTGTVSADGRTIDSDPGVGILAPGWHGTAPGTEDGRDVNDSGDDNGDGIPDNEQDSDGDGIPDDQDDDDDDDDDDEEDTEYEAGISITGEFQPLTLGADATLNFELPSLELIDYSFSERLNIPENPLRFGTSPSFGFDTPFGVPIPTFNINLFDLRGQIKLDGTAEIGGMFFIEDGSTEAEIELSVGAGVNLEASAEISNSPLCRIPFGVGDFLCMERNLPVPIAGIPQFEFSDEITFPNPADAPFTATAEASASLFAQSTINISARAFVRRVSQNTSRASQALLLSENQASASENILAQETEFSFSTISGFGNDPRSFYRYLLPGEIEITGRTSSDGNYSQILPANSEYTLFIYSPRTNRFEIIAGSTGASGSSTISSTLLSQFGGPDADGDGIPDFGEFTIGTDFENADSDGDGISDSSEIAQGLDPLGGQGFPTGVIASLSLQGQARDIVVKGSTLNAEAQTAYIATGSHGLAIVDASQFDNPIVLGQLDLDGNNIDVAVDANLQIAALAGQRGGLHFVDISDPMLPTLMQTIDFDASQVDIADGVAYATMGRTLRTYDLLTGEQLETVGLSLSAEDLTVLEDNVYVLTSSELEIFENSTEGLEPVSSIAVSGSPSPLEIGRRLFVDGELAYVGYFEGYSAIDVSNPAAPVIIGEPPQTQAAIHDFAANGSGLLLPVTSFAGTSTLALSLYDISDPTDVTQFITSIDTPGNARAVAVASGIAYVADENGGLSVVNYLPFDNQGVAPTITINSAVADIDANTPGIQVTEGSSIPVFADVTDDVQVRNVELLVDGEVVSNSVSYPFELAAIALSNDPDAEVVEVQARATDTGGNIALSNILSFDLVPDTFAPEIENINPGDGATVSTVRQTVQIRFSEPLAADTVNVDTFQLLDADSDPIPLTSVQLRSDDTVVQLTFDALPLGDYQLLINAPSVTDRAGNALGSENVVSSFTVDQIILIPDTVIRGTLGQVNTFVVPRNNDGGTQVYEVIDFESIDRIDIRAFPELTAEIMLGAANSIVGGGVRLETPFGIITLQGITLEQLTVDNFISVSTSPPIAEPDFTTISEGGTAVISVLANDSDADGDSLLITGVATPANGTVFVSGDQLVYIPAEATFSGVDSFTYSITDLTGLTDSATVTVTVGGSGSNQPPIANVDTVTIPVTGSSAIDVLANDSDPNVDDTLSVIGAGGNAPGLGSLTLINGNVIYAPNSSLGASFVGSDAFTYTISDNSGATATATVALTIGGNQPPIAADDTVSIIAGQGATTINVLANDSDPDGNALRLEGVGQASNGSVSIINNQAVYTAASTTFTGADSFTYTVSDGNGGTATSTVQVTVGRNQPPVGNPDTVTVASVGTATIDVLDNDSDPNSNDTLSIAGVGNGTNGVAIWNNNEIRYIPSNSTFTGTDSFVYTVTDGNGGTDSATVRVIVGGNQPPIATPDSTTIPVGGVASIAVLDNDSDPDGDPLLINGVSNPINGSTAISSDQVIYTPGTTPAGSAFAGVDTFFYTIRDGNGGTASSTVTVTVGGPQPPVAADDSAATPVGTAVNINVLANDTDADGDTLSISGLPSAAGNGTLSLSGGEVVYTPNGGFNGTDNFTYTVSDGALTDTATVNVQVGG